MRKSRATQNALMQQQFTDALRHATPEAVEMALKALTKNGTKRKKRPTKFKGTDHWVSKEQLDAICAVSSPFYSTLWRLCAAHALRIGEALSLRACNIENGYLVVQRSKGSQRTVQPLLVDLSEQINSGTYRLFPIHRSTAFLHFRKAAKAVGLRPDLCHCHVLRHSCIQWLLQSGKVPLHVASTYAGHTSLASTSAYLNCGDQKASAAAMEVIGRL